jgi:hypothetical protein
MITSENIGDLAQALAKAQVELQNPPKNKINPHFQSSYVDLADGLDVIRKILGKHGIAFVQATRIDEEFIFLHTRLMHSSGQWLESVYPVCGPDKHQAMGSAMTYARRYSIFGLVGVAGEDDDDGNTASDAKSAPSKPTAKNTKAIKPATLDNADSELLAKGMKYALDMVETREQLIAWATENKANKERLTAEHQKMIDMEFKAVQQHLKEKAAEEVIHE